MNPDKASTSREKAIYTFKSAITALNEASRLLADKALVEYYHECDVEKVTRAVRAVVEYYELKPRS